MGSVHDPITVKSEVRDFVIDNFLYGQVDEAFSNDDSFLEKGIIDSTGVLELVEFLESRYQMKIEDQDLVPENLDSVTSIVKYVGAKLRSA